jgi:hypothetical protein
LPAAPPEPPFSGEEAAHEARLPTAQPRTAFRWLHWLAPVAVGLLLGQLLLAAFGLGLGDWQNPLVWVASLAGALAMLVWYRALWNASRALSELYYLFNWGAGQARRVAWLAGAAVLAVLLSPIAVLLSALSFAPSLWNTPAPMAALLALVLMLPLAGLALTGGYFHGRQEVVANAVQARVNAERRAQAREARDRSESRTPTRAEPTDAPTPTRRQRQSPPPTATERRRPRTPPLRPPTRRSDGAPRSRRLPTPAPPKRTTSTPSKSWRTNSRPCSTSCYASSRARFTPTCPRTPKSGSALSTSSGDWRTARCWTMSPKPRASAKTASKSPSASPPSKTRCCADAF